MGVLFFIADLQERHLERLDAAGLDYAEQTVDGSPGVVLGELLFTVALDVLGATVCEERPTSVAEVERIRLRFNRRPRPVVFIESWPSKGSNEDNYITTVEEVLLPCVDRDIHVHAEEGGVITASFRGRKLHLCLNMAPEMGRNSAQAPPRLWGYPVDCRDGAYKPARQGRIIFDDEGQAAGEIVHHTAYLYHCVTSGQGQSELFIFRAWCEELRAMLTLSEDELRYRHASWKATRNDRRRSAFIAACSERIKGQIRELEASVKRANEQICQLEASLLSVRRQVRDDRISLQNLQARKGEEVAAIGVEFDRLISDPKILDVRIDGALISVFTDTLYCFNEKTRKLHEIGRMRIDLRTAPSTISQIVRIFNLTRRVGGLNVDMHHPHVFTDGAPCFGNVGNDFAALLAEYQIANAAYLAIQFVESVNPADSAGRYIVNWPVVSTTKVHRLLEEGKLPQSLRQYFQ